MLWMQSVDNFRKRRTRKTTQQGKELEIIQDQTRYLSHLSRKILAQLAKKLRKPFIKGSHLSGLRAVEIKSTLKKAITLAVDLACYSWAKILRVRKQRSQLQRTQVS